MAWEEKVQFYQDKVKDIRIAATMSAQDIRDVIAGIDAVMNEAFFDLSETQSDYEAQNATLQTKMSEYFLSGKDQGMSDEKAKNYSRVKANEEGYFDLKLAAERKVTFMENVVKLLSEKKFILNTSYGTIKLESDMG
jgi:hypothetical protein